MPKRNDMQRIAIKDLIFYQLLKENIIAKVSTRLKDPISSLNKMRLFESLRWKSKKGIRI